MTPLLRIILLLSIAFSAGQAATRSDINTIEAAERIRYLSQKIAKDYLYLYCRPKRTDIYREITSMVDELSSHFVAIASSTKEGDTRDLLKFLEYSKENMKELLKKKISKEGSLQMLDYSEILLEGAQSLARMHRYPFNAEERMLMTIKKDEYLVERLGKFYMATSLGALSQSNQEKMRASTRALQEGLKSIRDYRYPPALQKQKKDLFHFWDSSQTILDHAYDMFTPNLVHIISSYFEQRLAQYALYHSKSQ